jgi:uncharacterized protein
MRGLWCKVVYTTGLRKCHKVSQVFLRVFKDTEHTLVAVCDTGILGETFREGKLKLEVKTDFYKGTPASIHDALRALESADIANLAGDQIVKAAVQEGLVDPSAIIRIGGVSHVQIVKL